MKAVLVIVIFPVFLLGCSGLKDPVAPDAGLTKTVTPQMDNHWNWGIWQFYISEDHRSIDVIPVRSADYHYCVTKFMEIFPCDDCLSIGALELQPDSTIKLDVTLRHPFPSAPKYTGFDVRGMVYFPATMIQQNNEFPYKSRLDHAGGLFPEPYYNNMPIIFSRVEQGGGELLNADGYSCYMIPGLTYSDNWPIYSYSEPENNIKPTPEITTVNPYKLFCSDLQRRMFLVSDEITREYHIALPDGPFTFGYAIDASWWPANNLPVTDPATDFPPEANAEDPWLIEYEQLLPICEENVGKNIIQATIHHRGFNQNWGAKIWSWDLTIGGYNPIYPLIYLSDEEIVDDYTTVKYCMLSNVWWYLYGKDGLAVPGNHFGILVVDTTQNLPPYTTELERIICARFVDISVEG